MRCARVRRLAEEYGDGGLSAELRARIEEHIGGCARCARSVALARGIRETLASAPTMKAPSGFTERVMASVYREALGGARSGASEAVEARGESSRRAAARVYRRLGISFVLTAGILAVSLLVPRIAYPTLLGASGARIAQGSDMVVRGALTGADRAVRGALGEQGNGGNAR